MSKEEVTSRLTLLRAVVPHRESRRPRPLAHLVLNVEAALRDAVVAQPAHGRAGQRLAIRRREGVDGGHRADAALLRADPRHPSPRRRCRACAAVSRESVARGMRACACPAAVARHTTRRGVAPSADFGEFRRQLGGRRAFLKRGERLGRCLAIGARQMKPGDDWRHRRVVRPGQRGKASGSPVRTRAAERAANGGIVGKGMCLFFFSAWRRRRSTRTPSWERSRAAARRPGSAGLLSSSAAKVRAPRARPWPAGLRPGSAA